MKKVIGMCLAGLFAATAAQSAVFYAEDFNAMSDGTLVSNDAAWSNVSGNNAVNVGAGTIDGQGLINTLADNDWATATHSMGTSVDLSTDFGAVYAAFNFKLNNQYNNNLPQLYVDMQGAGGTIQGRMFGSGVNANILGAWQADTSHSLTVGDNYVGFLRLESTSATEYLVELAIVDAADGTVMSSQLSAGQVKPAGATVLDTIRLGPAYNTGYTSEIDNVVVASTWNEVVANVAMVPEPATLGLLGLAFGGMLMLRRKK